MAHTNKRWMCGKMAQTNKRWMCGQTRKYRIKNDLIWEHLGVEAIGDKLRETPLRWFGNVQYWTAIMLARSFSIERVGRRGHGRK